MGSKSTTWDSTSLFVDKSAIIKINPNELKHKITRMYVKYKRKINIFQIRRTDFLVKINLKLVESEATLKQYQNVSVSILNITIF